MTERVWRHGESSHSSKNPKLPAHCWPAYSGYLDSHLEAAVKHRIYSVAQARDQLPKLVHQAERGRPVRITRRGKPAAVLISETEFQRIHGGSRSGLGDAILAWREQHKGIDITDAEIAAWRDRSAGNALDLSDASR